MADECIIQVSNVADGEEAETTKLRMDSNLWPNLAKHLDEIERNEFSGVMLSTSQDKGRQTRGHSDVGDVQFLTTFQNRLQSLCKHTARVIEGRTITNLQNPYPTLITVDMAGCRDLQSLYNRRQTGDFSNETHGNIYLQNVMNVAKIPQEQQALIMKEYQEFKQRFIEIAQGRSSNTSISQNEVSLFELHAYSLACGVTSRKHTQCKHYMKIMSPRKVISIKFFLLSLKIYTVVSKTSCIFS